MKKQYINVGNSFVDLLVIVFIVLKLLNKIDWSWWWVLSPILIQLAIIIIVFIILIIADWLA